MRPVTLLMLVALLTAAACGDGAERARRGGTAVIGGYVDLRTMNPLHTTPDIAKALQRHALYTPLLVFDGTQQPQPRLAERWDTVRVAPDTLELTFHLRGDVAWHDGTPVTSRDVAFTFERARDPRTAYVDAAALAPYAPRAETPDARTVRVRLRAHPDFLEPWFLLPPLPHHVLGDVPPEQLAQHAFSSSPLGSGPFRFVRRAPGSEWVFEANPDFPEALGGRPHLDRLVYRTIPEQTGLITELLTGRIELALSIRPAQVATLLESDEVRVLELPVANWIFMAFNTRLPFFDTREERRALALAIDRQAIVDGIMGGRNVVGRSVVTPVHRAFDSTSPALTQPRADTARARALLEQAGWRDRDGDGIREDSAGRPFQFPLMVWQGSGSYQEIAQVIQAQLRLVGVAAEVRVVEFNTFVAQLQGQGASGGSRDFAAAIGNWTDNLRKDDAQLFHSRNATGPRFWTGFSSPRTDSMIDALALELDAGRSRALWREYQQALVEDAPLVVLFYARGINGVRQALRGLTEDWRGPLASVQEWWIEE